MIIQICAGFPVRPLPHTGSTAQPNCAAAPVVLPWPWTKLPTWNSSTATTTPSAVPVKQHLHALKVCDCCIANNSDLWKEQESKIHSPFHLHSIVPSIDTPVVIALKISSTADRLCTQT